VPATLLLAFWAGQRIGHGSDTGLALMLVLGLWGVLLMLRTPTTLILTIYPSLFFVPYGALRTPIPFFSSPIEALVVLFIAMTIVKAVTRRQSLPRNTVLTLWVVSTAVVAMSVIVKNWPLVEIFLFTGGMWSVLIAMWGVKTAREARWLLLSIHIPIAVLVFRLLFLLSIEFGSLAESTARTLLMSEGAFLQLSVATIWLMAISVSVAIFGKGLLLRLFFAVLAIAAILFVFVSGFASAVIMMITSGAALLILYVITQYGRFGRITESRTLSIILFGVLISALSWMLILRIPTAAQPIDRISNYQEDASGAVRVNIIKNSLEVFEENPIWGTFNLADIDRHNTYFTWAGRYGVFVLTLVFAELGLAAYYLFVTARKAQHPLDRAIVNSFLAAFIGYVVTGFLTPLQGDFNIDAVTWIHVGLGFVWLKWLESDPETQLIAPR
jgi:hypothetical protein